MTPRDYAAIVAALIDQRADQQEIEAAMDELEVAIAEQMPDRLMFAAASEIAEDLVADRL